jgi:hypothetical protein
MFVACPDRLLGHGKVGIREYTDCDADEFRQTPWLPEEVGAAAIAKVKCHGMTTGRRALEALQVPALDGYPLAVEEHGDAEDAARTPLAVETVTHGHLAGVTGTGHFGFAAVTGCFAHLHDGPLQREKRLR